MGLDMYLKKVKRIGNASANDLPVLNEYFDYLERDEKYAETSFDDWCGFSEDDVNKDLIPLYKDEFKNRFACWDSEKKYGWKTLFDTVGYWRKVNAIHNWFVENVQDGNDDCNYYEVSEDALEELLYNVRLVLTDKDSASEILPTRSGCFFGDTDYDEFYFEDLQYTSELLEKALKETDFINEIILYRSSW